jgi:hypothetical protein
MGFARERRHGPVPAVRQGKAAVVSSYSPSLNLLVGRALDRLGSDEPQRPIVAFLAEVAALGSRHFVGNLATEVGALVADGCTLPLTIDRAGVRNCFLCSPRAQFVSYAAEQMRVVCGRVPMWLRALMSISGVALDVAEIDRIVHFDNWLTSAGPGPGWQPHEIADITACLAERFPRHVIGTRALNLRHHAVHIEALRKAGYCLVPARRVLNFGTGSTSFRPTRDLRSDMHKLERERGRSIFPTSEVGATDYPRMAQLYSALNHGRYTRLNPAYTETFFSSIHRHQLMEFIAFRDTENTICAYLGYFVAPGRAIVAPIMGYDTSIPKSAGLYRMLGAALVSLAAARELDLSAGSGADEFKQKRGAEPSIEFNAYYVVHLPARRRLTFELYAATHNRIGPHVLSKLRTRRRPLPQRPAQSKPTVPRLPQS